VSNFEKGFCGSGLDLDLLGLEIDDNTLIPGLAVASSSATALAGTKLQISRFLLIYFIFCPSQQTLCMLGINYLNRW